MFRNENWPNIPKNRLLFEAVSGLSQEDRIDAVMTVPNWGFFRRQEVEEASRAGRMLMMDIDLGRDCGLNCPTCYRRFYKPEQALGTEKDLTYKELLNVVEQAIPLGLKTVKCCGAGEPFESPLILPFTRQLRDWGIGMAIFTKGHMFPDDRLVESLYGTWVIRDGKSLLAAFRELDTDIMLGFGSSDPKIQDAVVGMPSSYNYTAKRDRAAEMLVEAGFTEDIPTRMALVMAPLTPQNYDDAHPLYVYCRQRNILPVIAVLMTSGQQIKGKLLERGIVPEEKLVELYARCHQYNIVHGLMTLDEVMSPKLDLISCMPGIHPCNQIAVGMYVTLTGIVTACPGDSGNGNFGNVREKPLAEIWQDYRQRTSYSGIFNVGCPFKEGRTLPEKQRFTTAIRQRLTERLANKK